MRKFLLFLILIICVFPVFGNESSNNGYDYSIPRSTNSFGGIGSVITPTARFSDDGEFTFGVSKELPFNRIYAKMQFLPWMEAVLKYTETTYYSYNNSFVQTWKDKGIDVKFRLMEEGKSKFGLLDEAFIPELAVGINDIGGTGSYDSQYFVASKRISQNLDLSMGIGFGRLAGAGHINNPIDGILDSFATYSPNGGTLNVGKWFSGPKAAFFGGFEYLTPIENLTLKVEYDSTDYTNIINKPMYYDKRPEEIITIDSRINYALNYRLNIGTRDELNFSIGSIHGNTLYANVTVSSNLNDPIRDKYTAPAEDIINSNLLPYNRLPAEYKKYLTDSIMWQMSQVGFATHSITFNGNELQAEISQGRFQKPVQAIDLAARILAKNSPNNIEKITVINVDQGIETLRASIDRDDFVRSVSRGPLDGTLLDINNRDVALDDDSITIENDWLYPNYNWSIRPHALGTLQHQQKFYFWQIEALAHVGVSFTKNLHFYADYGINIDNNFEGYTYHIPDGQLYHVRQDRRLYLKEGESGIRRMHFDYLWEGSNPNIRGRFSGGLLEWMYGGIGGEVLYMPASHNWAIGLEAWWVKQRDFDQMFDFKDYETVTGFLNLYRDLPFYDMRFKMSAGKFLGKDVGVHLDLSRRFKNGGRVGGIVALTDCDSICTGEGSFNKWIYFELPMDLFYVNRSTRSRTSYAWAPLTKDQGSKIEPGSLYQLMINSSDEIEPMRMKQKSYSIAKFLSGFGTTPKKI